MAGTGRGVLAQAGASCLAVSPRFETEKEDDKEEKASKKLVADSLASIKRSTGGQVDVDGRMLEGRRANRGFTMSVGSKAAQPGGGDGEETTATRSCKRAQTLPAVSERRGDFVLSAESLDKLVDTHKVLAARYRRGSVSLAFEIVTDESLVKCWEDESTCHVHGQMTEGQSFGDERKWFFAHNASKLPGDYPPIVHCQKGSKGFRDTAPNQDNFSITYFKNGAVLACTFDGHGPYGHIVSTRTVQTVPFFFISNPAVSDAMKGARCDKAQAEVVSKAFQDAFDDAQKDLVAYALRDGWDVQTSGSTAVAALWRGNQVWTANAGDSRCVIGTEEDKAVVFETADHKPTTTSEKERLERLGSEVRTQTYSDGWVNHRIFVKGEDYPGLCMARTFGDEAVKAHGVIATPEVALTQVDLQKKPFLVLASDGIWEFLDSQFVVKAMAKKITTDGPKMTVGKLQREAKKRWKREEGDYCDDITSMLVQLR